MLPAQNIQTGTYWLYEQQDFAIYNPDDFYLFLIENDTTIQGLPFWKTNEYYLQRSKNGIDSNLLYIHFLHQDSNSIWYYEEAIDSILLLYDFEKNKGDTMSVALGPFNQNIVQGQYSIEVKIDSITSKFIEDREWFYQHVSSIDPLFYFDRIIIGVGGERFIFPDYGIADPPPGGELLCFNNGTDFYPSQLACETVLPVHESSISTIDIYPNPATNNIHIDLPEISLIQVFSSQGVEVLWTKNRDKIDLSNLDSGIYVVIVFNAEGRQFVSRIVKY